MTDYVPQGLGGDSDQRLLSEFELLQSYSTDVIYRLRYDDMKYEYISPSVIKLLGFTPEELSTIGIRSLIIQTRMLGNMMRRVTDNYRSLEEQRRQRNTYKWQADYEMRTKDGRKIWVADISYPWFDEYGAMIGSIGTLRDITDRVKAEEESRREAARRFLEDEVTGLDARPVFFDKLEYEVNRFKRNKKDLAVMLVSVDNLEDTIEKYGEELKESIIKEVGTIIHDALRATDVSARIDEGEFAACLPETRVENAFFAAERIRERIASHKFQAYNGETVVGDVSVGVSGSSFDDVDDADGLFSLAKYRLKTCREKNYFQDFANDNISPSRTKKAN